MVVSRERAERLLTGRCATSVVGDHVVAGLSVFHTKRWVELAVCETASRSNYLMSYLI